MTKDPLIWGTIKSEVQRYQAFNEHNELVPDLPSQEIAIRHLTTLRLFFLEEGLPTKTILDQENKFIDTELRMSDFTQEGIELIKSKLSSWENSQSARKSPPDLRALQKHLKKLDQEIIRLDGATIMNRAETFATLENKSSKVMQIYASSCLRHYCDFKNISHPAITKLLENLDSMPTTSNLSEWDAQGAQLDLNGRGDPIPQNIKSNLSSNDLDEFSALVDSVVEVGIVDLYGAQTVLPLRCLDKAMQILEQNAISLPARAKEHEGFPRCPSTLPAVTARASLSPIIVREPYVQIKG